MKKLLALACGVSAVMVLAVSTIAPQLIGILGALFLGLFLDPASGAAGSVIANIGIIGFVAFLLVLPALGPIFPAGAFFGLFFFMA